METSSCRKTAFFLVSLPHFDSFPPDSNFRIQLPTSVPSALFGGDSGRPQKISQESKATMWRSILITGMFVVVCGTGGGLCFAQEFRIRTTIYQHQQEADPMIVSRSVSIFHAEKVYDHVDGLGEVTIFDPIQKKLILLNESRMIKTVINFDEIKHLLNVARHQTQEYIHDQIKREETKGKAIAGRLKFQLDPTFETQFDSKKNQLMLESKLINYRVQCVAPDQQASVENYLRFADWMARLNYVLHPYTLPPASRIALNEELRTRNLIPIEVDLQTHLDEKLHLRAEHKIHWKLDHKDRGLIHHWETLRKNKEVNTITIQEYLRNQFATLRK
ncbi:MAG TPA: hypothetical protein DCY03_09990 [Planctomycetaceae bacterium]|nr:hypothetical protein [Planctomycetaceae bacterium]